MKKIHNLCDKESSRAIFEIKLYQRHQDEKGFIPGTEILWDTRYACKSHLLEVCDDDFIENMSDTVFNLENEESYNSLKNALRRVDEFSASISINYKNRQAVKEVVFDYLGKSGEDNGSYITVRAGKSLIFYLAKELRTWDSNLIYGFNLRITNNTVSSVQSSLDDFF